MQVQLYVLSPSVQGAPCLHGLEAHSSTSERNQKESGMRQFVDVSPKYSHKDIRSLFLNVLSPSLSRSFGYHFHAQSRRVGGPAVMFV